VIPSWAIAAVSSAPGGAHPSYTAGYSDRDNAFYERWDAISRDRDRFLEWMTRHVVETEDVAEYHARLREWTVSTS
jgi:glutaconate CoA-transferase subunit A